MRFLLVACLAVSSVPLFAETAQERLTEATAVFNEIMAVPEKGIPQDLLAKAHCVVVVPGLKKGGFIVGAKYGRGFATCRKTAGAGWGAPAAIRVEGGSVGFQIGASETDVVMLVMNERGAQKLVESQFTLGGDASVAAGPVGRTASASTDAQLRAEILSWSRSRGAFAGVSLEGATLRSDKDENKELYGKEMESKDILMSGMAVPAGAQEFTATLTKYSRVEGGSSSADRTKTDKK
jgi:lipid-binding SYLF domain-containing protein